MGKAKLSAAELRAIHAKKNSKDWSRIIPFDPKIVRSLENKEGNYELFDKDKKRIYVGSSYNGVKHRLESYYQIDDPKVHETKVELRPKIKYFRFRYIPIEQARIHEHNIKQSCKFNMDSHRNEIKKEYKE